MNIFSKHKKKAVSEEIEVKPYEKWYFNADECVRSVEERMMNTFVKYKRINISFRQMCIQCERIFFEIEFTYEVLGDEGTYVYTIIEHTYGVNKDKEFYEQ